MAAAFPRNVISLAAVILLLTNPCLSWKCDVNETVCEVWLELRHSLTMMKGNKLIIIKDGLLFPYNELNLTSENAIPMEDVVTADGWSEPRVVITVNGTVPGPPIEVHEHQLVRVHVRNRMFAEAASIHFHGMHQRGTPWMDGVAFVTQCPILPEQTFTYQFKAEPAGTFWYHSHIGLQKSMGVNGAFVVHPRQGADPSYHRQFSLVLQEWNHDWGSTMDFLKMEFGMYVNGEKKGGTSNLSGGRYSLLRVLAIVINGRARYRDNMTSPNNGAPLETFSVQQGNKYRFRLISAAGVQPFQVSVDGHRLRVVATDGFELREPVIADHVIVTPGERYDFELMANNTVANYWIRVKTLEVQVDHTSEAILHYEGAPTGTDPTTTSRQCTNDNPCVVVNCPFSYFPANSFTQCVNVHQLRNVDRMPESIGAGAARVKEYFVNFAFPGTTFTPGSANGVKMLLPGVSPLTQPKDVTTRCPGDGYRCTEDELCYCTSVLDLEHGEVAQIVMTNMGRGKGWDHPIHMHGHSFWVLKMGYPMYNTTTGRYLSENTDVNCGGNPDRSLSFCNRGSWANSSWSGNTVPGLELDYPIQKDTVNVPTGGYVVVRIKADNPGLWFFHCHVSLHQGDGMVLMLNESFPQQPPPPAHFPTCGDFTPPISDLEVGTACSSQSGYSCKSGTSCDDITKTCLINIGHGCSSDYKDLCLSGSMCDLLANKCMLRAGENCEGKTDKCMAGSTCSSGACTCNTTITTHMNNVCVPKSGNVGGDCSDSAPCQDGHAHCVSGMCECKSGYTPHAGTFVCTGSTSGAGPVEIHVMTLVAGALLTLTLIHSPR